MKKFKTHRGGYTPAAIQSIPFWDRYAIDPDKTKLRRNEAATGAYLKRQPPEAHKPKPEEQPRSKLQLDCDAILKRDKLKTLNPFESYSEMKANYHRITKHQRK